ncbi:MAG: 2-amino-4-hydroxy-6-hydroxymethyldihydropteridine diphosphokinase [Planctomycetota bacterium]|jgi:2-amino-4-hydroxy-6-hydroxymethyldihydropteridine diphosphokinase
MDLRAYIGLGSNLGDSQANLDAACEALGAADGVRVLKRSKTIRTDPQGGPSDQPDYWNAVLEIETELEASALLSLLHEIEANNGRRREDEERWGPRTLDMDLLVYGDVTSDTPELLLPHPRICERLFVLIPLAELAPEMWLPKFELSVAAALSAARQAEDAR